MSSNKDHVEMTLSRIRTIFEAASEKIEALKSGEKIIATHLADELVATLKLDMTGIQLYPTIRWLLVNYPGTTLKRGAHGGLFKN
jgi:hypothetical protein